VEICLKQFFSSPPPSSFTSLQEQESNSSTSMRAAWNNYWRVFGKHFAHRFSNTRNSYRAHSATAMILLSLQLQSGLLL
jgi:hypothetical protein